MGYLDLLNTPATQLEPENERQVQNNAGGHVYKLDKWKRLERFLILGSDSQTYYQTAKALTKENAACVLECLKEDYWKTLDTIVAVSRDGRAPKNDAAIFALALAYTIPMHMDVPRLRDAFLAICRTSTHLFQFVDAVNQLRGWGRRLRRHIQAWYRAQRSLAYQVTKYPARTVSLGKADSERGRLWSHRDVLRLAHPKAETPEQELLFRYVVAGPAALGERAVARGAKPKERVPSTYPPVGELTPYLAALEELKSAGPAQACTLIQQHRLAHEHVPHELLKHPAVWEALAQDMPLTALIRHLGKLTECGVIAPGSDNEKRIAERISAESALHSARVHPVAMLMASVTYGNGKGGRGKLTWAPTDAIKQALEAGFYASFKTIEPSNKRIALGLDVSGSMDIGTVGGVEGFTPRMAAAVMAMVTMRTEKNYILVGFSDGLVPVPITPDMKLQEVMRTTASIPMGGTDCSLPVLAAIQLRWAVDAFVIYTDNETWAGGVHPRAALKQYRERAIQDAKMAVVAFTSTGFTIADPEDPGMLDCVGFDSGTPAVMASFIRG